tara:strand:+ start:429 stop:767 length:339 start_codon:yes stop_codon:yes gene_type:complete
MYLYIFILILVIIIFYIKKYSLREHFELKNKKAVYRKLKSINNIKPGPNWNYRNKTLTYNPYFKENKTLKNMIAEMAHDTLNNKLKKGPTLVDMKPITKLINKIRISPIINL